jgi:hypothetical protein
MSKGIRLKKCNLVDHLKYRKLNTDLYNVFTNEEEMLATFLLFNLSGQITGYQNYRPNESKQKKYHPKYGRYYTFLGAENNEQRLARNKIAVFGLETYHFNGPLFLCEGIFDICRIHNFGLAGIATLSNDPKHLSGWLRSLGRPLVAICDNDSGGHLLSKHAHMCIKLDHCRDVGEMKDSELRILLKDFI